MVNPTCHQCEHVRYSRFLFFKEKDSPCCARHFRRDHVTGRDEMWFCSTARSDYGMCGARGRTFSPKQGYRPLEVSPQSYQCPYCLEPVGILGNWLAKLFGVRFHGCTFSNVTNPEKVVVPSNGKPVRPTPPKALLVTQGSGTSLTKPHGCGIPRCAPSSGSGLT